ncbi:MAG: hypothetical protein ACRDTD_25390, partial [Pseudonocardiaceae bacterium]
MGGLPLRRVQHRNEDGSDRTEPPSHGELVVDVERFVSPLSQVVVSSLHLWGVAQGLAVTAVAGKPGLIVAPGVAVDGAGGVISVAVGGSAVVDPAADPSSVTGDTVPVSASGVGLPTTDVEGEQFLVVQRREVQRDIAQAPNLVHAPWLRLVPVVAEDGTQFEDDGAQVVLARVRVDNGGVAALTAENRRLVGVPVSRVELRCPTVATGGLGVDQDVSANLLALPDGGVELNLQAGEVVRPALSVDGATGNAVFAAAVGIGTANPAATLDVAGDVKVGQGVNITGHATIDGTATIMAADVTGVATITTAKVTGDAAIDGRATITTAKIGTVTIGDATIGKSVKVGGSVNIGVAPAGGIFLSPTRLTVFDNAAQAPFAPTAILANSINGTGLWASGKPAAQFVGNVSVKGNISATGTINKSD